MAKERPGMMLYFDLLESLEMLSGDEVKTLIFAMVAFSRHGKNPDFQENIALKILWPMVSKRLTDDAERYEEVRKKRSDAGKDGADAKAQNLITESFGLSEDELKQRKKDFEVIAAIYPKKNGKAKAFNEYLRWFLGRNVAGEIQKLDNRTIYLAVNCYVKEQEYENTELKFYKSLDSLLGLCLWDYAKEYVQSESC